MNTTPKRPRRLQRDARPSKESIQSSYMQNLPDDILLHIFKNLKFPDLLKVKRVCRRFRRLYGDRSLWKDVDVSSCLMSTLALRHLLRYHFPSDMHSLKLRGYLTHYRGKPAHLNCIFTNQFLYDLNKQCPNLQMFSVLDSNIPQRIHLSAFPNNLTKLQLWNCHFASAREFFSSMTTMKLASTLKELDLSLSKGLSDATFVQIATLRNLQVLCLHGSGIIHDRGIQFLAGCLPKLESLDLGQLTNITDTTLFLIASHFKTLQNLNISKCSVTLTGIFELAEKGQMLRKLIMEHTINEEKIKSLIQKFPTIIFITNV